MQLGIEPEKIAESLDGDSGAGNGPFVTDTRAPPLLQIGNDLVSDAGVNILGEWAPLRHDLPPSLAGFPQDAETKAECGTQPITGGNRPTRVCGQAVDRAAHPATQRQT